jgi:hypothetical protein
MKIIRMSLLLLLALLPADIFGLNLEPGRFELEVESLKGQNFLASEFTAEVDNINAEQNEPLKISHPSKKSPFLAFALSAAIPGAGQLYNGSNIFKSIGFFVFDGALWGGHIKWHQDGLDLTHEFEAYADQHWTEGDTTNNNANLDPQTYRGYLLAEYGDVNDTTVGEFTHSLPSTKTQQYYEMIGKYDQFAGGWDDYWVGPDSGNVLTFNRLHYEDMRKKANDKLDQANTLIYVSIINHLISAVDAAVSAKRHNSKFGGADGDWSIKTEMHYYSATEQIPIVRFTRKF